VDVVTSVACSVAAVNDAADDASDAGAAVDVADVLPSHTQRTAEQAFCRAICEHDNDVGGPHAPIESVEQPASEHSVEFSCRINEQNTAVPVHDMSHTSIDLNSRIDDGTRQCEARQTT